MTKQPYLSGCQAARLAGARLRPHAAGAHHRVPRAPCQLWTSDPGMAAIAEPVQYTIFGSFCRVSVRTMSFKV
jgi:hypothetical protein